MASGSFYSRIVATRDAPGASLTLLRQPSARRLPRHDHARPYFSLLVAGSYVERFGARALEHRGASVVYHPPAFEHVDAFGDGGGRMLVVEIDPRWAPWQQCRAPRDPAPLIGRGALQAAWRLCRATGPDGATSHAMIEESVLDLLAGVASAAHRLETRRPRWLDDVVERLRVAYVAPPSLTVLAAEAGVHAAHLRRTFRRFERCGPSEFVQRAQVEHVWRCLMAADAPSLVDAALERSGCSRWPRRRTRCAPPAACT